MVLALHCYSGDTKKKYGLLSNHLFQREQEHGGWKEPTSSNQLLSKQVLPIAYTLEKKVSVTFGGLWFVDFLTD